MSNAQGTVIIRERGQLTIPDSIRKMVDWINPSSAVSISVSKPDEIVIKPHQSQGKADWEDIWKRIEQARSFKGKGRGNLSAFIAEDRERRR